MGFIYARVACRSPQRVLSVRRCVVTPGLYITVGLNFVSILSLVLITSKYFGSLSWRLAGVRADQIRPGYAGKSNAGCGLVLSSLGMLCVEFNLSNCALLRTGGGRDGFGVKEHRHQHYW